MYAKSNCVSFFRLSYEEKSIPILKKSRQNWQTVIEIGGLNKMKWKSWIWKSYANMLHPNMDVAAHQTR